MITSAYESVFESVFAVPENRNQADSKRATAPMSHCRALSARSWSSSIEAKLTHLRIPYLDTIIGTMRATGMYMSEMMFPSQFTSSSVNPNSFTTERVELDVGSPALEKATNYY